MTRHCATEADIKGQTLWNQALENWSLKISVGCTVPHFLRTTLVAQHGPGITAGTLQHETKGPKLDLEHDPRENGPASSDWGPYLVAYGGEPKDENHGLLVDTFLKIALVGPDGLEYLHRYRCNRCKETNANPATEGEICGACLEGT
eukprot:9262200-Heterocapsa_arctica.AAC.1